MSTLSARIVIDLADFADPHYTQSLVFFGMESGMGEETIRILVVEDDDTFRETVRDLLRDAGYKVRGARSVRKATKRLTHHTFDLVLTDVDLGDASGFEVLEVANARHPDAKLVVMSASQDPELSEQALQSGAARFLAKPFRAKTLLETVIAVLGTAGPADSRES